MSAIVPPGPPAAATPGKTETLREVFAGVGSVFAVLAVPLTLGMIVFAPLGPAAAAAIGIPAALVTTAVGGLVLAPLGGSRIPTLGPSSATALILAGLVHRVVDTPGFDAAAPGAVAGVVAAAAAAVALMGLLILAFGLAGLGTLVRYVPRPVLSGFMSGVALMIVLSQLPMLLGIDPRHWHDAPLQALATAQPGAVALGAGTVVLLLALQQRRPRWPGSLIALVLGTALVALLLRGMPGASVGGLIGALPTTMPAPTALAPWFDGSASMLREHAWAIATTGLALAVIGALESMLNAAAVDQDFHHRTNAGKELRAIGLANLAGAAFGALPGPNLRLRAVAIVTLGGRGRLAAVAGAVGSVVLLAVGLPLLEHLPRAVLAGVMLVLAIGLFDRWALQLLVQVQSARRAPDLRANLAIVAAVMAVTVFAGFAAGVAVGVLLSMALLIASSNRSLLRARWRGPERPSRRVYGPRQEAVLTRSRQAIVGVEVEGALHFGSAERLAGELEPAPPGCRFLVLDLRRVSTLEASGVAMLVQLAARLAAAGVQLMPAGLQPGAEQALASFGGAALLAGAHPDADRAVEAAERRLLEEAGAAVEDAVPLTACSLFAGLDAAQAARVEARLQPRTLAAGERLFAEGDPGDALYVVSRGSIAVVAAAGDGPQRRGRQRYVTIPAGMMLGETALLDGGGRTADAIAETDAVVWRLAAEDLDALRRGEPALAATLLANIALHLSQRLRAAASAWREHAA